MLKLLTCPQGHFWETPADEEDDPRQHTCPVCGAAADSLPLLDLVGSTAEPVAPPPQPPPAAATTNEDKTGRPVVAGYEIQEALKRGPTGVAQYRARQILVNRTVVLKVVLAREDPGQIAWGSLRGEASALGRLAHPNIVQIFEAGERERQLFYNAVEYVEGPSLANKLGEQPLPWRQAARLVEVLARALQHAHDQGIVHRNLKPACILLQLLAKTEATETSLSGPAPVCQLFEGLYLPRIIDFGLARRPIEGDINDLELYGNEVAYLSPEQVWGRSREIGQATDIYALGALLYRLLSGQPPFQGESRQETIDAIQVEDPAPLSALQRGIPADLDFVCRKCLSRQPRRRYARALDLAEDLALCVERRPIKARITGRTTRMLKWVRRQPSLAALTMLLGVVLVGFLLVATLDANDRARLEGLRQQALATTQRANERAEHASAELRQLRQEQAEADYQRQFVQAVRALNQNQAQQAEASLDQCASVGQKFWEWHYLKQVLTQRPPALYGRFGGRITQLTYSSDGRMLAVAGSLDPNQPQGRGEVQIYSTASRFPVFGPLSLPVAPQALAFSADGRHLAAATNQAPRRPQSGISVWKVPAGVQEYSVWLGESPVTGVAFTRWSDILDALEDNGRLSAIDASKQPPVVRPFPANAFGHGARMDIHPMDGRAAIGFTDLVGVSVWDLQRHHKTIANDETAVSLAFDPAHASLLAVAGASGRARIWNVDSQTVMQTFLVPRKSIRYLAYSPDGKRLATQCGDGSVQVWDPRSGELLITLRETTPIGAGLTFRADSRQLAISGMGEVKVWGAED